MGDLNSRLSGLSEVGYNWKFLLPTFGLVLVLIVFFIIVAIIRKSRKGRTDMLSGVTYLDVTGMGKQGLLTNEEMANIRAAMSRQVARQQHAPAIKAPANLSGELALMADPEVQRLEAIAQQSTKSRETLNKQTEREPIRPAVAVPTPPTAPPIVQQQRSPDSEPNYGDPIPSDFGSPVMTGPVTPSAQLDASTWTRTPEPVAAPPDVQLPPDVLKMAELGLITPDELEKIKSRIREKKQQLS